MSEERAEQTEKTEQAQREGKGDMAGTLPVAHTKEWLLSLAIVAGAYIYLSTLGFPTILGDYLWKPLYLSENYIFVAVGWLMFAGIFLTAGLVYLRAGKREIPKASWGYLALTVAAAMWFPFYYDGDQDITFFMVIFMHGVAVYWLLTVTGNRSEDYLNERGIFDLFRGFVILPFSGYLQIFKEWANGIEYMLWSRRKSSRKGWQIFFGVMISVPVLCIVVPILMEADVYFKMFAEEALSGLAEMFRQWNLGRTILDLILTMIIACYLYGLFYKAFHKPIVRSEVRRQAPQIAMISFLVPIVLVYVVFFGVRLAGVAGAMKEIAEGDLWISTYAREGFFELCRLAAINLIVFGIARWYSPEAGKPVRILLSLLGGETLAFIVLAFSKMWYYISAYSFTFKRVMCCWLLLTLFVLFSLMIVEIWQKKLKGMRIGVIFGCVTFLMLAYSNMPMWAP